LAGRFLLIHFGAMSIPGKFAHGDLVKVISTGETGTVKVLRESEHRYVYGVQLSEETATETNIPEDELELVKKANDDETGFAIRYIS
jgi:hypothetical protein